MKANFESLGLDYRVLRGIERRGISTPTPVQVSAIPTALEGKDIVARAHTGTGKTLAYIAPVIHRLLLEGSDCASFSVIVLVPTSELCEQVRTEATTLAVHCASNIRSTIISGDGNKRSQEVSISSAGQIVVTTPGRLAKALKNGLLSASSLASSLKVLVLDEADLLLSYGYEEDLQILTPAIPRDCQCMLMSATMSADVDRLIELVLHNPIVLDLTSEEFGEDSAAPAISHAYLNVINESNRLITLLALIKLGLVPNKVLVFVNTVDMAYRTRLFMEAFGTRVGTLVPTLPLESRHSTIEQFNASAFQVLVACESQAGGSSKDKSGNEFGVTRGVDFKGVATVINAQPPASASAYTHRVGRTGRAGSDGLAVSLIGPEESKFLEELKELHTRQTDANSPGTCALQEFTSLKDEAVAALTYRGQDVLRSLTKRAVRDAQLRHLKLEIVNCSSLKDFFDKHQADANALRHDRHVTKHVQKVKHLRHLPDYLKASCSTAGVSKRARQSNKRKVRRDADPIKGKVLFNNNKDDEPTEMESRALEAAKKVAKKQQKAAVPIFAKKNVRKRR